jgi:hypothetical protein
VMVRAEVEEIERRVMMRMNAILMSFLYMV